MIIRGEPSGAAWQVVTPAATAPGGTAASRPRLSSLPWRWHSFVVVAVATTFDSGRSPPRRKSHPRVAL